MYLTYFDFLSFFLLFSILIVLQMHARPFILRMLSGLLWSAQRPESTRTVRFRRQIPGNSEPEEWRLVQFGGMLLSNVDNKLRNLVGKRYVICVQACCFGRLTPLVTNLPRKRYTINLVLLSSDPKVGICEHCSMVNVRNSD
jgi:hypothetical protein